MKRISAFLASATLLSSFSVVAAERVFKTGMDSTFPPASMVSVGGEVQGYFVDVAREVAKWMGGVVDIEVTSYAGIIPGLVSGKYDWLVPTAASKERAANILFTDGFIDTDFQFLVKRADPGITDVAQLKGKSVAVNKGSLLNHWCNQNASAIGMSCDVYDTVGDAVQAVLSGRAYTALANDFVIKWVAKKNPTLKASLQIRTGQVFAMSTRKSDVALRDQISMVIKCMKHDETLAKLYEKWIGVPPAAESVVRTIGVGTGVPGLAGYDSTHVELKCS